MKLTANYILVFLFAISATGFSQNINKSLLGSLAVDGYDVVSYFTDGKPVKGNKKFTTEYLGAKWRFASQDHLDLFKKSPGNYAPQYGGYCAWAVSQNYTANADPLCWKIVNEKLYLNYNNDVQADWAKDIPNLIDAGNKNWKELSKK